MNYIRHLTAFFERVAADSRLNPTHVSLYMAIFQVWNVNRFQNPVSISRSEMMRISKISGNATYHKVIKDLHQFGYFQYNPSHNPFTGSLVHMFNFETSDEQVLNNSRAKNRTSTEHVYINNKTNSINSKTGVNGKHIPTRSNNRQVEKTSATLSGAEAHDMLIPLPGEVSDYFRTQKYPELEADKFFNYYSSNGWTVGGKTKMRNWQAAARNWMINAGKFSHDHLEIRTAGHLATTTGKNYAEPL